jgi:hypothetical protein
MVVAELNLKKRYEQRELTVTLKEAELESEKIKI